MNSIISHAVSTQGRHQRRPARPHLTPCRNDGASSSEPGRREVPLRLPLQDRLHFYKKITVRGYQCLQLTQIPGPRSSMKYPQFISLAAMSQHRKIVFYAGDRRVEGKQFALDQLRMHEKDFVQRLGGMTDAARKQNFNAWFMKQWKTEFPTGDDSNSRIYASRSTNSKKRSRDQMEDSTWVHPKRSQSYARVRCPQRLAEEPIQQGVGQQSKEIEYAASSDYVTTSSNITREDRSSSLTVVETLIAQQARSTGRLPTPPSSSKPTDTRAISVASGSQSADLLMIPSLTTLDTPPPSPTPSIYARPTPKPVDTRARETTPERVLLDWRLKRREISIEEIGNAFEAIARKQRPSDEVFRQIAAQSSGVDDLMDSQAFRDFNNTLNAEIDAYEERYRRAILKELSIRDPPMSEERRIFIEDRQDRQLFAADMLEPGQERESQSTELRQTIEDEFRARQLREAEQEKQPDEADQSLDHRVSAFERALELSRVAQHGRNKRAADVSRMLREREEHRKETELAQGRKREKERQRRIFQREMQKPNPLTYDPLMRFAHRVDTPFGQMTEIAPEDQLVYPTPKKKKNNNKKSVNGHTELHNHTRQRLDRPDSIFVEDGNIVASIEAAHKKQSLLERKGASTRRASRPDTGYRVTESYRTDNATKIPLSKLAQDSSNGALAALHATPDFRRQWFEVPSEHLTYQRPRAGHGLCARNT